MDAPRKLQKWIAWLFGIGVVVVLCMLFPRAMAFVEMAAIELRYFWWLVLLVALAVFLMWGFKDKKP